MKLKKHWNLLLEILVAASCLLLLAAVCNRYFAAVDSWDFLWVFVLYMAYIFTSYYPAVILHEGGHLLFGLLTGYTFISFRIGSTVFVKTGGKITRKKWSVQGTGGQCLMAPPSGENAPFLLYNFGGAILNLAVAVVGLGLSLLFQKWPLVQFFFLFFALLNLCFALLNGIPLNLRKMPNDGANALGMLRDKTIKKAVMNQLKITSIINGGKRIKDIPTEDIFLTGEVDYIEPHICVMKYFAYSYYLDKMDFPKAKEAAEELLQKGTGLTNVHRRLLECEALFLELIGNCDKEEVEKQYGNKKLQVYLKQTQKQINSQRVLYAYSLLYLKDETAAQKHLLEFNEAAKLHPYPSEVVGERELLEVVRQKYQERFTAPEN